MAKRQVAVAAQIPGTGKTILGVNIIRALNRPRESSQEAKRIALRLMSSRQLTKEKTGKHVIQAAIDDPRNESLTVRAA